MPRPGHLARLEGRSAPVPGERPYLETPLGEVVERRFRAMGLTLAVESNSPAILEAAEASFRGFGPAEAADAADLRFRLFDHGLPSEGSGRPVLRTDGPLVYQTTGRDSTLVADLERGTAFGYFSPDLLAEPASFRWHFLDLALFYMLEWRGFIGVHGAALAKRGRALLLRAPSGEGKTVLAYAGARSGLQALAEDVVWIAPKNRLWWGAPWAFRLLPDARDLFPELRQERARVQINGEEKIEVDLESRWPGSTVVSARPAGVLLLRRVPGGVSRLEPVAPEAARAEWLRGCASREGEVAGYDACVDALLGLEVHRLDFGDDIPRALELVHALLDATST